MYTYDFIEEVRTFLNKYLTGYEPEFIFSVDSDQYKAKVGKLNIIYFKIKPGYNYIPWRVNVSGIYGSGYTLEEAYKDLLGLDYD